MSATWMLGSTIVTILLAVAAMALERVLALYRRVSLRWVWVAAAIASVAFMAFRLVPLHVSNTAATELAEPFAGATALSAESRSRQMTTASRPVTTTIGRLEHIELPTVTPAIERTLLLMWGAASALFAMLLLSAAWRLRNERDGWSRTNMAGSWLLLSPNFGPAIVGVLRPEIVVPEWITELDESSRHAIVAHETEHLRAHDPALMFAGLVVVVLMPWNIGLWLCWRGLRRTIELDCDARVLAGGIQGSDYANVLLGAWQRARSSWLPSTAFAERASGLGRRVEHLMRPEPRRRAMRSIMGAGTAALFVLMACVTPSAGQGTSVASGPYPLIIIDGVKRPELPPRMRFTGAVVAETTTTPTFKVTNKGPTVFDSAANKLYPREDEISWFQMIDAPASAVHFGPEAKYGAMLYYTKKYRVAGGAILFPAEGNRGERKADPNTPPDAMVQRILDRLFNGVALTPDQKSAALAIIGKSLAAQQASRGPGLVSYPRIMKLQDERDVALRALLTTDADRAKFDVHSAEQPRTTLTTESVANGMFTNLFAYDTLTLNRDADVRAHEIIRRALVEEVALYERTPSDFEGRLAIRRKRDADLRELLTSDRDRAKFDVRAERTMQGELKRP